MRTTVAAKHFADPADFEPFVAQDVAAWLKGKRCGDPWWGDRGWLRGDLSPTVLPTEHLSDVILGAARDYNLKPAVFLAWMEAEQPTFRTKAPAVPANPRLVRYCVGYGATDSHDIPKYKGGREQLRQLAFIVRAYLSNPARFSPYEDKTVAVGGVQYGPLNALEGGIWTYATDKRSLLRRCARVVAINAELEALTTPSPPPPDTRLRLIVLGTNEVLPYRIHPDGYHPEIGKVFVEPDPPTGGIP